MMNPFGPNVRRVQSGPISNSDLSSNCQSGEIDTLLQFFGYAAFAVADLRSQLPTELNDFSFDGNWNIPNLPTAKNAQTWVYIALWDGGLKLMVPTIIYSNSLFLPNRWSMACFHYEMSILYYLNTPLMRIPDRGIINGSVNYHAGRGKHWLLEVGDSHLKKPLNMRFNDHFVPKYALVVLEVHPEKESGSFPQGKIKFQDLNVKANGQDLNLDWKPCTKRNRDVDLEVKVYDQHTVEISDLIVGP